MNLPKKTILQFLVGAILLTGEDFMPSVCGPMNHNVAPMKMLWWGMVVTF